MTCSGSGPARGRRSAFPGPGGYAEGASHAILHVIAGRERRELLNGVIDHNAFTGQGLVETVGKLKVRGLPYDLGRLPGYGTWQLFFFDLNGAKVEIDFDPADRRPPEPRLCPSPGCAAVRVAGALAHFSEFKHYLPKMESSTVFL